MTRLVEPFDFLLDGRTGWRARSLDRVAADDGALRLRAVGTEVPPTARATLDAGTLPRGVAVRRGELFVADPRRHVLWRWRSCWDGPRLVATIGPRGRAARRLDTPTGLAVSARGDLVVVDRGNRRLQLFTLPDLALRRIVVDGPPPAWDPVDVAAGADGALLVADGEGRVVRLDRQGRPDPFYLGNLPDAAVPDRIVADAAGTAYVGLEGSDTVVVLDRHGFPVPAPPDLATAVPSSPLDLDRDVVVLTTPRRERTGASVDAAGRLRISEPAGDQVVRLLLGGGGPDVLGSRPIRAGVVSDVLDRVTAGPPPAVPGAPAVGDDARARAAELLADEPPPGEGGPHPPPSFALLRDWVTGHAAGRDLVTAVLADAVVGRAGGRVLPPSRFERLRDRVAAVLAPGPLVRAPASPPRYPADGIFRTEPLDSGRLGNRWHRVVCELDAPERTGVALYAFASDVDRSDVSTEGLEAGPVGPWAAGRLNAREWLLPTPPGRYLHLALALKGPGDRTPAVERVFVYAHRDSSIRFLPAVYQEEETSRDTLDALLSLTDTVTGEIETVVEAFPRHLDPAAAPEPFLPWLASWFDLPFEPSWSETQRRAVLAGIVDLYRCRGTVAGLTRLLQLHTGIDGPLPRVVEHHRAADHASLRRWLRDPPEGSEARFTVLLPATALDTADKRAACDRLVRASAPAHTAHELRPVVPGVRLDCASAAGSALGFDSLLGDHRPWRLPDDTGDAGPAPPGNVLPPDVAEAQSGLRVGGGAGHPGSAHGEPEGTS